MKVSVWMTAYNHEKYISQCLDSILNQKTDFDYEIILGEDCSKDRTREIAIEYQKKFPDKIKLFLPEKNIGMMQMDLHTHKLCTGEFLALMNGDDFWTDENKLQTQVDFLESNPDTVLCYHKAKVENESDGTSFETVFLEKDNTLPVESLLLGYNPIMTPTVMIRNIINIPEWYTDLPYGDMPLYLLLAQKGKLKYIDRMMSVYRIHLNGQWQGETVKNNILKDLNFYKVMNERLGFKYELLIKRIFIQRYFDLVRINIMQNDISEAKIFFNKLVLTEFNFNHTDKKELGVLYKILFEQDDVKKYEALLNREVKWKVS